MLIRNLRSLGPVRLAIVVGVLLGWGCRPNSDSGPPQEESPAPAATSAPQTLRLVAVDDESQLAEQIARLWTAETGGQIEVTTCDRGTLPGGTNPYPAADLWMYPSLSLGEMLAAGWLQPLDSTASGAGDLNRAQLLPLERGITVQAGESVAGVSLGSPLFVVLYRRDVWESLSLPPPRTWREYHEAAAKIRESSPQLAARQPPLPSEICEPWHDTWLVDLFLARAASQFAKRGRLSTVFDIATMDPLVATPPFIAAAEEMATLRPALVDTALTPAECYRRIVSGQAAMAIAFVTQHIDVQSPRPDLPLEIVPLPASDRIYDYRSQAWTDSSADQEPVVVSPLAGHLVSLGADCRRIRTAKRFLDWLSLPEINRQIGQFASDAAPVTDAAIDPPYEWLAPELPRSVAEGWAALVRDLNLRALAVGSLRIEHRDEFIAALREELDHIVAGSAAPEAGLGACVSAWNKLLEKYGRESLWRQYRATSGVE